eukprot:CAMPEP_0175866766 /NCGR_PEP_ID=MMETSP0107_2-20121207/34410_1 /TAXON_ID=195067 ORGANISM="Goniomonas pacifica, Strain CCMP1869" /NCGR_SAMPLE_ID=MMETSP0107_2 /ASSEMBLY_ACC=CAM_ASM_000203 /LENGTH=96 /DNA_ID=CAMNT_0017184367 /DNA_START=151 /DNA_END=441 /DNA_ORIENTATION=-
MKFPAGSRIVRCSQCGGHTDFSALSIVLNCTGCRSGVAVPAGAKRVKCARCGTILDVPERGTEVVDEEVELDQIQPQVMTMREADADGHTTTSPQQ